MSQNTLLRLCGEVTNWGMGAWEGRKPHCDGRAQRKHLLTLSQSAAVRKAVLPVAAEQCGLAWGRAQEGVMFSLNMAFKGWLRKVP